MLYSYLFFESDENLLISGCQVVSAVTCLTLLLRLIVKEFGLSVKYMIDVTRSGNVSRFINHR
jgi:hypothetical protein